MDPKQLKKLAKACRDAGISSYTCPEFSFTLTDHAPEKKSKTKESKIHHEQGAIEAEDTWESLSEMDRLFYSVNPGAAQPAEEETQ